MSWLLCPRCLTWVRPAADACPLCVGPLDPAAADPTAAQLAARLGEVTACVGEVLVPRRTLPGRGLLLATTRGLFFLPHRPEVVVEPGEGPTPGVNLAWSLAGLAVGPLALLVPATRWLGFGATGDRRRVVFEPRPVPAGGGGGAVLAEHLMADPGAFFLDRADVRLIRRTGPWPARGWTAECVGRPAVRWRALSDPAGVDAGLRRAARTDAWHGAVV